jgi:hypothetical protein
MKKFVVLLVVVAMTAISAMAYAAAEVTVSGEMAVRSRDFSNLDMTDNVTDANSVKDTQQRVQLSVNAKAGDVKGKITLWNDFETWDGFETQNGSAIGFRESWISFNLPGIPVNVTAGHQLLTLGNGWFFRSMHYGSDAWVIANQTGNNTAALVNVKFDEGTSNAQADDTDAYVLLDVVKLSDDLTVGVDFTNLKARHSDFSLYNLGLNANGKFGPVALKAELDLQAGDFDQNASFKGNQLVVQGNMALDPVTVNFTVARGSGDDGGTDVSGFANALDVDPHYTFLYEYKIPTTAINGASHGGFSNTTALSVGASFAATKSLTIGADAWLLQATEDVACAAGTCTGTTSDIGTEVDVKINWAVAENLSWNWNLGMFMPGDAMGNDTATGVQGALSFKF